MADAKKQNKRAKDQAMAAAMKKDGVERKVGRCPICGGVVALNRLADHVSFHS